MPRAFRMDPNGFFDVSCLMLKLMAMACVALILPNTCTKHSHIDLGP